MLMNTLQFGLSSLTRDALQASCEAVAALARFHQLNATSFGTEGVPISAACITQAWHLEVLSSAAQLLQVA